MPEQQNIEYKQSWHDDYLKWVCGFANAVGGFIYIGKDKAGQVVHIADYEKLLETIPQKIRNDMGIVCDVNLLGLSIWNEGLLPFGLSLEDLKVEHNSRPRNPKIAEACFLAGYIDAWGRGTLKIINACNDASLPPPDIKEMNGGVEVTVFNLQRSDISEGFRKDFGRISERIRKEYGKEIASTVDIIEQHPDFSSQQIAKEIGKTARTVENYLAKLKKAGIVVRKGPKLGGHWEIIEKP